MLLLPRLPDLPGYIAETPGLRGSFGNLFSGADQTRPAHYLTPSVVRQSRGCHGGIPRTSLIPPWILTVERCVSELSLDDTKIVAKWAILGHIMPTLGGSRHESPENGFHPCQDRGGLVL